MGFLNKIWKSSKSKKEDFGLQLQTILGYKPKDLSIYRQAFTHSSSQRTDPNGNPINNERLEFLGDVMLSAIISAYLYHEVPFGNEGYLTKMRSKIVSREHLNELGHDYGLVNLLTQGSASGQLGRNIEGNLFEALIGAIYLDKGYEECTRFIHKKVLDPYVDIQELEKTITSYKSLIIEWCQKTKRNFSFEVVENSHMPEQDPFLVKLIIDNQIVAEAHAPSKKKGEELACKKAYERLINNKEIRSPLQSIS